MVTTHNTDQVTQLGGMGILNIMVTRMQCIDFPFRNSMRKTFHDMVRHDGIKCLYMGLLPVLLG